MNCEKYSEWISLYIDGELEEKDRVVFENHMNNCNSCHEEIKILQEITNNIKDLEMIEPPQGFHEELMRKIKLEHKQKQGKVIPLPVKKNKWYSNLKVVSAVAAVFIFSAVLLNPPKTDVPIESLPELADNMPRSRMIDAPAESFSGGESGAEIQGAAFSQDEVLVETNQQIWVIETQNYKEYKESIIKVSEEMGLEVIIVEEVVSEELNTQNTTMEITLENNEKAKFESKIREVDKTTNIMIPEQSPKQKEQEENDQMTLVIIINQIN